jgi:hypothetical protein
MVHAFRPDTAVVSAILTRFYADQSQVPPAVPDDDAGAVRLLFDQLPNLLSKPGSCLVLDEIQELPQLVVRLVHEVHTRCIEPPGSATRICGQLVLLGTPAVGDAVPIDFDLHTSGKLAILPVPSMTLVFTHHWHQPH